MKLPVLMSIGHNIADSLAAGPGFMAGCYPTDIFEEASVSPEGSIVVDFLTGEISSGVASLSLVACVGLYGEALHDFCSRHGVERAAFAVLTAEFGTHPVHGKRFRVVVEDQNGRRGAQDYYGSPGRRLRRAPRR